MLFRYHMLNLKHYAGNFRNIMEQKSQLIFEIEPVDPAQLIQNQELTTYDTIPDEEKLLKVRLDKWLWAARFFKTRALARSAVEHGRVFYDGQKTIPSKEIAVGATVLINHGKTKKIIIIRGLSTRRRSTDEASALFEIISPEAYGLEIHTPNSNQEATHAQDGTKPRKMVRFLRRALAINEADNE